MLRCFLIAAIILFNSLSSFCQLKLQVDGHFLPGQSIKKVHISPEDYTVWVLTLDSKVFYKPVSSNQFTLYPNIMGYNVSDVAGYSIDEMYFSLPSAKILQVKNNVLTQIAVPGTINGLAVVARNYIHISQLGIGLEWIAIATSNHLYYLPRGQLALTTYPYMNPPAGTNWQLYRSNYKGATFRFNSPEFDKCSQITSSHTTYDLYFTAIYSAGYPDSGIYPSKINTGLFTYHAPYTSNIYDFWGTDEGLYLSNFHNSCSERQVMKFLPGSIINDLDEVHALSTINVQQYVLAATDKGIAHTPASIYYGTAKPDFRMTDIQFISSTDFPKIEVYDLEVDSRPAYDQSSTMYDYNRLCDQVVWAATENGVYKVSAILDQNFFDTVNMIRLSFNSTPTNNDTDNPVFERCSNQQPISVSAGVGTVGFKIRWYKDGQVIPSLDDKSNASISEAGTYQVQATALCEGITLHSAKIVLNLSPAPEVSYPYAYELILCKDETMEMSTISKPGYTYRWFRDQVEIPGENGNTYTINQAGKYHVEVSNCAASFVPSKTITIIYETVEEPKIVPDKTAYCQDEEAILSVSSSGSYPIKWFLDGNELTANANKQSIRTKVPGKYSVLFNATGCQRLSEDFNLVFSSSLTFTIKKSTEKLICFGDKVILNTDIQASSYKWSTGETSSSITVSKTGDYSVELTSAAGCKGLSTIHIIVEPPVDLPDIADTVICTIAGEKLRLYAKAGFGSYTWNGIASVNEYYDVSLPGTYNVLVKDANGCTANTLFTVLPWCKAVIIPNTFTPNGDGINDNWQIGGLENDPDARILIFNRQGNKVFQRTGSGISWDGKLREKELPQGTYYYILKTKNSTSELKGSVTIIR